MWYVTSESNLVRNIVKFENLSEYERKHLLPYLKQFVGNQSYKENKEKRKKFYDEREWRYIPDNSAVEVLFGISKSKITKAIQNADRMLLDLTQIEYIIIEKESDFDIMLTELKKLVMKRKFDLKI